MKVYAILLMIGSMFVGCTAGIILERQYKNKDCPNITPASIHHKAPYWRGDEV